MSTSTPCEHCRLDGCRGHCTPARIARAGGMAAYLNAVQDAYGEQHGATEQSDHSFAHLRARLGLPQR